MMVQPPRLRDQQPGGRSAGTTTSYIVESRDYEQRHRCQLDDEEAYYADHSDGRGSSTEDSERREQNIDRNEHNTIDDYGVELVLNQTTDSQRARDMIVPGSSRRRRGPSPSNNSPCQDVSSHNNNKTKSERQPIIVETVDSQSVASTADSRASSKHSQRPRNAIDNAASVQSMKSHQSTRSRFMRDLAPDGASVASKSEGSRTSLQSRALFDDTSEASSAASGGLLYPLKEGDTIWRAAKRGDLNALKRFHSESKVDWAATDQFGNSPLYYACHSGAIVDINVVHFLLWVTPIQEVDFEACKNRKNKRVMKILHEFEGNGYTNPFQRAELDEGRQKKQEKERKKVASSRPPRPRSSSKPSRNDDVESASIGISINEDKPVVRDKALQSIMEDVNKIHVSPSNVTNMTIDTDDWSLGSMLSFGKQLKRRKGTAFDRRGGNNDEASIGSRNSRTGSLRMKDSSLRRKVSFEDHSSKMKADLFGLRRSPREKVSHVDNKDDGFPPRVEYEEDIHQWTIENHVATDNASNSNIVLTIHVFDSNQKVVIRNCHGVSVDIRGKTMKSVTIADSSDLNVVFDSVSDTCDIIHSKNIAAETTGICRHFTMDRTKGINIWLNRESRDVSKIVTSKCTEVSVLLPIGDSETDYERRELTLPEKYTHQFTGGRMKSRVSSVA
ncbi:adenylate cyclase associated (CAP) C terminal-domain containing protein [Nitzschia inconspicua]|uniref:Adenylate cyclase associated (CAP) C terminal-domain containing protein n=1 Tax=Nitzschia inconspicua TaxID=303405 RepID=A0A9K3LDW8_9STRA|nr:adenylate cyclase associated (CAP) C terminal-domain containing protein [Nitzschia inconspicua]